MMAVCPVCGRMKCIHWPEHWVYRRGSTYYCSDNCMYVDATRDLQMMHKAIHKGKEAWKNMARIKKDGTPAKKPGRKTCAEKLAEVKEAKAEAGVELVYDPSIAEEYRREQAQKEANERVKAETIKKVMDLPAIKATEHKQDRRDIWTTSAIRNDYLGVFYYDAKYNTVDWRHPAGEEISLPPADWNLLANALPEIMRCLGVDNQEIQKEV